MREIKFRAWELNKGLGGRMMEPFTLNDIHNRKYVATGFADEIYYMQFTGRKDKNGKEVYGGDIVKCVNEHIGVVEWEVHDACFNVTDYYDSSDDYPTMAFIEGQPFEVIGNIYENPELINPKL